MANLHPPLPQQTPIGFGPNPVSHSPSPLAFGFGLSGNGGSNPRGLTPIHISPHYSPNPPLLTGNSPPRISQKRRHEPDDENDGENHSDTTRNHIPADQPRRTITKRVRMVPIESTDSNENQPKGDKKERPEREVDVGVLLASIPSQSLLPLLTALLAHQPSLKPLLLSLIPRPTLEAALQALAESAKKLRDAYPYSQASTSSTSTSFGFGATAFGFGSPSMGFGSTTGGFGTPRAGFGAPSRASPTPTTTQGGGMRDTYVLSRLRPAINDFLKTAQSYLPYFSMVPEPTSTIPNLSSSKLPPASGPSSIRPIIQGQSQPPAKAHPTETQTFLSALTQHILSFPPILTQSSNTSPASTLLTEHLIPRLLKEWSAWVDYVDNYVNRESGMFSEEVVRGWCRNLDEFAGDGHAFNTGFGTTLSGSFVGRSHGHGAGLPGMKEIRDRWVARVGWLIGRVPPPPGFASGGVPIEMEEEEEL